MKRTLLSVLAAYLLIAASAATAADGGMTWTGSASLGLRGVDDKARDPSKLNEYRDLDSGLIGDVEVQGRSSNYHFHGFIENPGRDDQYLDLRGGMYGMFKYRLYSNELRHNFGSGVGALSPYSGIGSPTLTATFPNLTPSTWNTFDHSYRRRDLGGMFEISLNSPWYFRTDANQVTRKGVNVLAGAQGTSPGSGFIDLPAPIDYKTTNYSAEAGYQGRSSHFAVNVAYSRFSNGNDILRWSNGFFAPLSPTNYDTTILPPDNEMLRISANGNVRKLPWDSTLAGRVTYSKLTNEVPVLATMLGPNTAVLPNTLAGTGSRPSTGASSSLFHGEIRKTTLGLSLSSHPLPALDTRAYWNWAREDNHSTHLTFDPLAIATNSFGGGLTCSGFACTPEPFGYKKNNLGIEAGYRVNRQNKVSGGFDWYDMERERIDFTENTDRKLFVEWKNSTLDELTGRLKYQYLTRRSTYALGPTSPSVVINPIELYVRRFDLANVDQNLVKLVLDSSPIPFLDLGFEAIYKKNDYKDTALGRTDDQRQEFYASVSFGDPKSFRVMVFGDLEFTEYNSTHRVGSCGANPAEPPQSGSPPACSPLPAATPPAPPVHSSYTWGAKNKDRSWQVGVGADWLPQDRLKLSGSFIWAKTEGTTDFVAQPGTVLPAPFLPIPNFDNTIRTSFNLKGTYKFSRQWEVTAGFAHERYKYSDIGYTGTAYTVGTASTSCVPLTVCTAYTTGQYAFQPYRVNVYYLIGTFRF
jgi:MtrB/PioB family decaheme-associated outer membrane protein